MTGPSFATVVLVRWTDASLALTGWGWLVLLMLICTVLGYAVRRSGR